MRVYSSSMYGRGTIFVTPGKDHPETTDWIKTSADHEGRPIREPIQFAVKFTAGMAEVDDQLGEYMLKKRLASRSPLIIPVPPSEAFHGRPQYAAPIEVGRRIKADGTFA